MDADKTRDMYEEVYLHLRDCADELYKAGFDNSLLYRIINSLIDFIVDLL